MTLTIFSNISGLEAYLPCMSKASPSCWKFLVCIFPSLLSAILCVPRVTPLSSSQAGPALRWGQAFRLWLLPETCAHSSVYKGGYKGGYVWISGFSFVWTLFVLLVLFFLSSLPCLLLSHLLKFFLFFILSIFAPLPVKNFVFSFCSLSGYLKISMYTLLYQSMKLTVASNLFSSVDLITQ